MSDNSSLSNLRITVIGLGLMGGSMAKALHRQVRELVAVDPDSGSLERALAEGILSSGTSDLREGISNADVIILAAPVRVIIKTLHHLPELRTDGCFLLDLGSTKVEIGNVMSGLPSRFEAIGGHPLCGREHSGFQAASATLYDGETFALCHNRRTTQRAEDLAMRIVSAVNAQPLFLTAAVHDEILALTSHMPYLVAAMLSSQVADKAKEDLRYWQISATGLRDITRLAGSNSHMMLDILNSNRQAILEQLREYDVKLQRLIHDLESNDGDELAAQLQAVRQQHKLYMDTRWNQQPGVEAGELNK